MVQKGTTVLVGFQGLTLTGVTMESFDREPIEDIKDIRGENNASMTKLISNPGFRIAFSCIVKTHATFNSIKKGDAITINSLAYMVESSKAAYSREEVKWSIGAVKEDSMTY